MSIPTPSASVAQRNAQAERASRGKLTAITIGCIAFGIGAGLCLVPSLRAYGVGLVLIGLFLSILGVTGRVNANSSPDSDHL